MRADECRDLRALNAIGSVPVPRESKSDWILRVEALVAKPPTRSRRAERRRTLLGVNDGNLVVDGRESAT
jgi:hypothetical protein